MSCQNSDTIYQLYVICSLERELGSLPTFLLVSVSLVHTCKQESRTGYKSGVRFKGKIASVTQ